MCLRTKGSTWFNNGFVKGFVDFCRYLSKHQSENSFFLESWLVKNLKDWKGEPDIRPDMWIATMRAPGTSHPRVVNMLLGQKAWNHGSQQPTVFLPTFVSSSISKVAVSCQFQIYLSVPHKSSSHWFGVFFPWIPSRSWNLNHPMYSLVVWLFQYDFQIFTYEMVDLPNIHFILNCLRFDFFLITKTCWFKVYTSLPFWFQVVEAASDTSSCLSHTHTRFLTACAPENDTPSENPPETWQGGLVSQLGASRPKRNSFLLHGVFFSTGEPKQTLQIIDFERPTLELQFLHKLKYDNEVNVFWITWFSLADLQALYFYLKMMLVCKRHFVIPLPCHPMREKQLVHRTHGPTAMLAVQSKNVKRATRWWFRRCVFSPLLGEDFQFEERIFLHGWLNYQL